MTIDDGLSWFWGSSTYVVARIFYDGGSFCWIKGRRQDRHFHRIDGPAYETIAGMITFCVNNIEYKNTLEYCKASDMDEAQTLYWFLKYGETLPLVLDDL